MEQSEFRRHTAAFGCRGRILPEKKRCFQLAFVHSAAYRRYAALPPTGKAIWPWFRPSVIPPREEVFNTCKPAWDSMDEDFKNYHLFSLSHADFSKMPIGTGILVCSAQASQKSHFRRPQGAKKQKTLSLIFCLACRRMPADIQL